MNLSELFHNQYILSAATLVGGIIISWVTQKVLNRRGVFSYSVNHNRVGLTTEDAIFGNVAVLWNGQQKPNLWLSTIEMKNESMTDYENVVVCAYTSDTSLMTEQSQLLGTPDILQWSESFKKQMHVEPGGTPTVEQWRIYGGKREYLIPVFNRGQSIKITFLNSASAPAPAVPTIWLNVAKAGVNLKFRSPQPQVLGVPQGNAALVGFILGIIVLITIGLTVTNLWVAAGVALAYGFTTLIPGAFAIKVYRWVKEIIGG